MENEICHFQSKINFQYLMLLWVTLFNKQSMIQILFCFFFLLVEHIKFASSHRGTGWQAVWKCISRKREISKDNYIERNLVVVSCQKKKKKPAECHLLCCFSSRATTQKKNCFVSEKKVFFFFVTIDNIVNHGREWC